MAVSQVTVLGATGSIGTNALDVIKCHPAKFQVFALAANSQADKIFEQCLVFQPRYAVMADENAAEILKANLKKNYSKTQVLAGEEALAYVAQAPEVNYVVSAIVGAKALLPTLAAIKANKRILLANKEALVIAGAVFKKALQQSEAVLLPVDSEHNAVFQCMGNSVSPHQTIRKITLTASGGPFRTKPLSEFAAITPEQACAHPNWKMGRKISVDSATMMNKALEVIEAYWLFDLPPENIDVILHPQSIVHSLVEYIDGSVLAQLSNPDMRIPIAHALAWPERMLSGAPFLELIKKSPLTFEPVTNERYPCLALAYQALSQGGTAPAILNAANEEAVNAFLQQKIRFTDIFPLISYVQSKITPMPYEDIETVLKHDVLARQLAFDWWRNK